MGLELVSCTFHYHQLTSVRGCVFLALQAGHLVLWLWCSLSSVSSSGWNPASSTFIARTGNGNEEPGTWPETSRCRGPNGAQVGEGNINEVMWNNKNLNTDNLICQKWINFLNNSNKFYFNATKNKCQEAGFFCFFLLLTEWNTASIVALLFWQAKSTRYLKGFFPYRKWQEREKNLLAFSWWNVFKFRLALRSSLLAQTNGLCNPLLPF